MTTTAIVLSVLFTLFSTVLCCVRPDFSSPYDSKFRILSTKLNVIFWVVICPEVVLFWAMRQWLEAGKFAEQFQSHGWTRYHGLFLIMGGFVLCDRNGKPLKTMSSSHFKRFVNQKVIDFPTLTTLEIQERSHFHPIFALIAFLQAIWFVSQCFYRFIKASTTSYDLPVITHFELTTAVIVISNWCIFLFAWRKPLDVQSHILIKPIINLPTPRNHIQGTAVDEAFELEQNIFRTQIMERRFQLENPQLQSQSIFEYIHRFGPRPRSLISAVLYPIRSICDDLSHLLKHGTSELPDGTLKIPLFYVRDTISRTTSAVCLLAVAGLGMGVSTSSLLLVLQFSSVLPISDRGQIAWRIAAITSTSFSALILGLMVMVSSFYFLDLLLYPGDIDPTNFLRMFGDFFASAFAFILLVGFAPFLLARFVLVVISIICFRPVSGEIVRWSSYLPHFS